MSSLARVTSPPYDVIDPSAAADLLAGDPYSVVRLILPQPGSGTYSGVARELRDWLAAGVLVADARPALYVYEQSVPGGPVLQRGLIGALRLPPPGPGPGPVVPHEDVVAGPVAGRLALMEATQANLEPIFLLYDGDGGSSATALADEVAAHRVPLADAGTSDGIRHRIWAVTDPDEHKRVNADLGGRQALIADGHHRYAAYCQLRDRQRAAGAGPGPWDAGLALLVDSSAFPPHIGAVHRVVAGVPVADAARLAAKAFTVSALAGPGATPGQIAPEAAGALTAALAAAGDGAGGSAAFVLSDGSESYLVTSPDPGALAAAAPGRSPQWLRLSASVRQELLFARLWGIRDDEDRVAVHHDATAALNAAQADPPSTAVLCPPLSADSIREVAAQGERVPRKSTSFTPKPRTGLVMRLFANG